MRGGPRKGAGRPRTGRKVISATIAMEPKHWDKLDAIRGDQPRGKWVADRIEKQREPTEKPLFIPLKREWFEAFESGEKTVEYRKHGPRWNERHCRVGRPVVLSLGYRGGRRLRGVIVGFTVDKNPQKIHGWADCYGDSSEPAACIEIELER